MKKRAEKVNIKFLAVLSMILIIIVTLFVFFNSYVNDKLAISIQNELEDLTYYQKLFIDSENSNNINYINTVATSITQEQIESESVDEYLRLQMPNSEFAEMYFVDLDGNAVSSGGINVDFSRNVAYNKVLETKELSLSLNEYSSIVYGILDIATPVFIDSRLQGVLVGVKHINYLFDEMKSKYSDDGYLLITDNSGNAIVSTSSNYVELASLEELGGYILEGVSAKSVFADISEGQSGSFEFVLDGVVRVARYEPLELGDMALVAVQDVTTVQEEVHSISKVVAYISFTIIITFVAFATYIWRSKKRTLHKIEQVAYYDELTGLVNLTKLKKDVRRILNQNPHKNYAIIKVDVLNFKSINEIYGFGVGNKVLCAFREISEMVPEKSLIVSRTGVDEFVFFAGNGFLENLENETEQYEALFKYLIPELENHHLSFTYGRYFIEQGETDVDDIINKVSLAHSMAKVKKKSVIWDYDEDYKKHVINMTNITNKMQKALADEEFYAFLQPKINLNTGELVGAEALVRWIEQDGNMIYPDVFIPNFESNGFIVKIDMFILECVCKTISRWMQEGKDCVPISVNFSRVHLENLNYVEDIKCIVDSYGIAHSFIEVEITETTLLENMSVLKNIIDKLHQEGFSISVDDFGAGYSSLGMLKEFEVDTIKLDRSFVTSTDQNTRARLVIDGIIKMAHSLDLKVVAEGTEDEEQIAFLKSIGCDVAQGYYFARPMKVADFETMYINRSV